MSGFLPATRLFKLKSMIYSFLGFKLGKNVAIGKGIQSYVLGSVHVGENTWLGRDLDIVVPRGTSLIIGSNVDVGPYVKFQCGTHKVGPSLRRAGVGDSKSIRIGDGTWIGTSCIIVAGANVGKGTVIGAGAVVTAGNYPDNVLLAGVPAKVIKRYAGW